ELQQLLTERSAVIALVYAQDGAQSAPVNVTPQIGRAVGNALGSASSDPELQQLLTERSAVIALVYAQAGAQSAPVNVTPRIGRAVGNALGSVSSDPVKSVSRAQPNSPL
ncbi:unnamed protein product, partial [Porites lobata]